MFANFQTNTIYDLISILLYILNNINIKIYINK